MTSKVVFAMVLTVVTITLLGEAYGRCPSGATRSCTIDGKRGIRACDDGVWGECEIPEPPEPPPTEAQGNAMQPGEVMYLGKSLTSPNGQYSLHLLDDGTLELWQGGLHRWQSTEVKTLPKVCIMRTDGNLVILAQDQAVLWETGTSGHPGSRLIVQDDGDLVIYDAANQSVWSRDNTSLSISSVQPTSGPFGTPVTIRGKNVGADDPATRQPYLKGVRLGNAEIKAIDVSRRSKDEIAFKIPMGAQSGQMVLLSTRKCGGEGPQDCEDITTSTEAFTVTPGGPPIITGFEPASGEPGTRVTISGSNLFAIDDIVYFNGVPASASWGDTHVTATVPYSASNGPITVVTPVGSVQTSTNFTVLPMPAMFCVGGIRYYFPGQWGKESTQFSVGMIVRNVGGQAGSFMVHATLRTQLDPTVIAETNIPVEPLAPRTAKFISWRFPNGLPALKDQEYELNVDDNCGNSQGWFHILSQ